MILMLSPVAPAFLAGWHIVALVAVFLSLSAFLLSGGLLWLLSHAYKGAQTDIQDEQQAYEAKREKRSAAAHKGHETRRAKVWQAANPPSRARFEPIDAETERVLRQMDAQAKARGE